jgi:hypothetical protein
VDLCTGQNVLVHLVWEISFVNHEGSRDLSNLNRNLMGSDDLNFTYGLNLSLKGLHCSTLVGINGLVNMSLECWPLSWCYCYQFHWPITDGVLKLQVQ